MLKPTSQTPQLEFVSDLVFATMASKNSIDRHIAVSTVDPREADHLQRILSLFRVVCHIRWPE